jgi:hypothetical protein
MEPFYTVAWDSNIGSKAAITEGSCGDLANLINFFRPYMT